MFSCVLRQLDNLYIFHFISFIFWNFKLILWNGSVTPTRDHPRLFIKVRYSGCARMYGKCRRPGNGHSKILQWLNWWLVEDEGDKETIEENMIPPPLAIKRFRFHAFLMIFPIFSDPSFVGDMCNLWCYPLHFCLIKGAVSVISRASM